MRRFKILIVIGGFALPAVYGCGTSASPGTQADARDAVYYDRATKAPVVAPRSEEVPAKHPVTGKPTLVPALYCKQCDKWYPAPPLEVQQRNPESRNCPKHKKPMTTKGPLPK